MEDSYRRSERLSKTVLNIKSSEEGKLAIEEVSNLSDYDLEVAVPNENVIFQNNITLTVKSSTYNILKQDSSALMFFDKNRCTTFMPDIEKILSQNNDMIHSINRVLNLAIDDFLFKLISHLTELKTRSKTLQKHINSQLRNTLYEKGVTDNALFNSFLIIDDNTIQENIVNNVSHKVLLHLPNRKQVKVDLEDLFASSWEDIRKYAIDNGKRKIFSKENINNGSCAAILLLAGLEGRLSLNKQFIDPRLVEISRIKQLNYKD